MLTTPPVASLGPIVTDGRGANTVWRSWRDSARIRYRSDARLKAPISETAEAIAHYFEPNELLNILAEHPRIVHHEERREWDHTHGRPHVHGKAIALAVPKHAHPPYRGDHPEQQPA